MGRAQPLGGNLVNPPVPQIGDFPAQRGAGFEIAAVLVPDATSDYLLGARTYSGVQLVPADPGADVAGLVGTRLPPGTDTSTRTRCG